MNELGVRFGPPPQQSALSNYTEPAKKEDDNGNGHGNGNGAPRGVQLTGACPLCGGPLAYVEGCVKCAANCGYSECS